MVVVAIEVLRKVPSVKFMLGIFDVVVSGLALKVPVAVVAVDAVVVVVVGGGSVTGSPQVRSEIFIQFKMCGFYLSIGFTVKPFA